MTSHAAERATHAGAQRRSITDVRQTLVTLRRAGQADDGAATKTSTHGKSGANAESSPGTHEHPAGHAAQFVLGGNRASGTTYCAPENASAQKIIQQHLGFGFHRLLLVLAHGNILVHTRGFVAFIITGASVGHVFRALTESFGGPVISGAGGGHDLIVIPAQKVRLILRVGF